MKTVTIVGSGVSGTLLTINLIKNYKSGQLTINLIEKESSKFNTGVAYSTEEFSHLLNVRASGMSIFKDDTDHFYKWLNKFGYNYEKTDFVPRKIFGQYIKYYYKHAIINKSDDITFNVIFEEVKDIKKSKKGYEIQIGDDKNFTSDIVVLALGHISIAEMDILKYKDIPKYFRTPWTDNIFKEIKKTDDVFMIGSGLTTDDIILSLEERKHEGKIYSTSRKGSQPLKHQLCDPYPSFYDEIKGKDINQIFSIVRYHLKMARDPRAVIDSLRPYTQEIWKSLSKSDKSRFLRHINGYWNVIRHRMPESTYEKLIELQKSNKLEFLTGNITSISQIDNRIQIVINNKKSKSKEEIVVDAVINCIGPESNYKRITMPLIKNLLDSGLIQNNETNISLKLNGWNIIDSSGKTHKNLFAIGPLLKGELFESTAVPEIKVQSEELSKNILKCLNLVTV